MSDGGSSSSSLVNAFVGLLNTPPRPTDLDIAVLEDRDLLNNNYFVKIDTHIGINALHLPFLACQFRAQYTKLKQKSVTVQVDMAKMMDVTTSLLCVCPDNATAWADRSRAIVFCMAKNNQNDFFSTITCPSSDTSEASMKFTSIFHDELHFLNLLFTRHSSKPSPWSYRKWICKQYIQIIYERITTLSSAASFFDFLLQWAANEISAMSVIVEGYPKNYYAWTHKNFVVQTLLQKHEEIIRNYNNHDCFSGEDKLAILQYQKQVVIFLEGQVQSIDEWLPSHVSDHSAAHYGATVLRMLVDFGLQYPSALVSSQQKDRKSEVIPTDSVTWAFSRIQYERNIVVSLLEKYPMHETLWLYRRNCILLYFSVSSKLLMRSEKDATFTLAHPFDNITAIESSLNDYVQEELASFITYSNPTIDCRKGGWKEKGAFPRTFFQWVWYHLWHLKLAERLYDHVRHSLEEVVKNSIEYLRDYEENANNMWKYFDNKSCFAVLPASQKSSLSSGGKQTMAPEKESVVEHLPVVSSSGEKVFDDPTEFWLAWNKAYNQTSPCDRKRKGKGCSCFEGLGSVM